QGLLSHRKSFCKLVFFLLTLTAPALCQDRATDQAGVRGNRAEVAITIKDGSRQIVGPLVTVKLYYLGTPVNQMTTTRAESYLYSMASVTTPSLQMPSAIG